MKRKFVARFESKEILRALDDDVRRAAMGECGRRSVRMGDEVWWVKAVAETPRSRAAACASRRKRAASLVPADIHTHNV